MFQTLGRYTVDPVFIKILQANCTLLLFIAQIIDGMQSHYWIPCDSIHFHKVPLAGL
jgi:hypothetical protein